MPTVTGVFKDMSGNALADVAVELIPTEGIQINGSNEVVLPIRKKVVTDSNGAFSTSLEAGGYQLDIEGVVVECSIPDQAGTVDLSDTDIITNEGQGDQGATY